MNLRRSQVSSIISGPDYSMTDTAVYVTKALAELEMVKSEGALTAWADVWTNSTEYAYELDERQVRQLEDGYDRKLRQFIPGVLAG